MRVLLLAALLASRPTNTVACKLSAEPRAYPLVAVADGPAGHRPLIALWMVKQPIAVAQVPATCKDKTICKGTTIAVDQTGNYLRPKAALPDGARVQVTMGTKLIGDFTVTAKKSAAPPAWNTIKWVSAAQDKDDLCAPAGPVVRLTAQPPAEDRWVLVYLDKPDADQPMAKLATVVPMHNGNVELRNGLGQTPWMPKLPKQIWVRLADGEGNLGPVVQLP
jgi:hypothetical protein